MKCVWYIAGKCYPKRLDSLMNLHIPVIMCKDSPSLKWWFLFSSYWGVILAWLCLWISFNIPFLGLIYREQISKKKCLEFLWYGHNHMTVYLCKLTIKVMIKISKTYLDLGEGHLGWTWEVVWIYSGWNLEFGGAYCFFKWAFVQRVSNSTMQFIP